MLDANDANAGLQSEPWPPVPLDAEFFERCEQHLGAKLDHDTRKELQRAVWQAWFDLAQHSPLTAENADRLYNIANLTTQLSFEIQKLEKDAPGLNAGPRARGWPRHRAGIRNPSQ